MTGPYPNDQGMPAAAMPVRLVNASGTAFITPAGPSGVISSTAAVTPIPASATSVSVLTPNALRIGAMFFNSGTAGSVFLIYGAGPASAASFTVEIAPGGFFNMPITFTGAVQGIWSTTTGAGPLMVTELTP